MEPENEQIQRLKARLDREKAARKQAEQILEEKSLELFKTNQELTKLTEDLELQVKQRTEALQVARDEALQLARTKSQFLANMSHEFKTPLNGILGSLSLLKESELSDRQIYMVDTAENSGENLVRLVNNVLDVNSLATDNFSLLNVSFNAKKVFQYLVDSYQNHASKKKNTLKLQVDGGFPDVLKGDPTRVKQILEHLLSNALKFTENGKIDIHLAYNDQGMHLNVIDTGAGIPSDKQNNIFDIFTQGDTSFTRDYGGIGLGLTLCQKLTTLMGGIITLKSQLGSGTNIEVVLPLAIEENTLDLNDENEDYLEDNFFDDDEHIQRDFSHEHVLLVEDNVINQEIARDMLLSRNLKVTIANNGQEALALLASSSFDLILMDVQMPVMDGLEATRRIRASDKSYAQLPIIALTAHGLPEDREKSLAAGVNAHLTKPINLAVLTRKIAQFLRAQTHVVEDKQEVAEPTPAETPVAIYGIDFAQALERMMENKELLEKVLQMFIGQYQEFEQNVNAAIDAGDGELTTRLFHSLKGSTGNISATAIWEQSAELEKSIKDNTLTSDWRAQYQEKLTSLCTELSKVIESINQYYENKEINSECKKDSMSSADLKRKVEQLKEDIYQDLDAVQSYLERLQSIELPDAVGKELALFEHALQEFDYQQMEVCCDGIMAFIDKG